MVMLLLKWLRILRPIALLPKTVTADTGQY